MNLRQMLNKRLTLGNIRVGAIVSLKGNVVCVINGDIQHRSFSGKQTWKILEIGKNVIKIINDDTKVAVPFLITSADKITLIKKEKTDGESK